MNPEIFRSRLGTPGLCFNDTLAFIDAYYVYQPSAFANGDVSNTREQNQGSCKVLAMAIDLGLSDTQALQCFAEHYQAVLDDPQGESHGNIRALMNHGLIGVSFERPPLTRR
ncbi:MAG TPA: HopJ type III effector protein [Pseudomonas xinjiangensis]|uniref:HopJ type III effector protein n=2 Tax=root TaxID=1 RepID=A0A7V1BMW4_9GAMM|nr:HopJ type III effector protein [Halopseudomonas xinjiangensis]HEC49189.1 HopJ type III effector protein [Halopseudomonas xinjiangensis]